MPLERKFLLASLPPPERQQRLAATVAVALLVACLLMLPFRDVDGPREQAFIPIVDTVLFLSDLITAVLLYAQFAVVRSRALLALAMGYLFTALIIVPHLLTFPGAFSPTGLLGGGLQSSAWLYIVWHLGLPCSVIAYAVLKPRHLTIIATRRPATMRIASSAAFVAVLALVVVVFVTTAGHLLPPMMRTAIEADPFWKHTAAPVLLLLSASAMVILWRRRSSVLDLWLLVVLWAWFIETALLSLTGVRFSVVWYAGRAFGILASSFVLLVLLYESTMLYARMGLAVTRQEREREHQRLTLGVVVGSIAHELTQPLTGILANSEAGIDLLAQHPPDLHETRAALSDIAADANRANEILKSIRDTVADSGLPVAPIDMGQVVREALGLLRAELRLHAIAVELEVRTPVPAVQGNKGQLLQVLLNLVTNAVESMSEVANRPRVLLIRLRAPSPAGKLSVTVEDTGTGIDGKNVARIFDPVFTTKSRGTGLGLAICRSIVEAHGGYISASARAGCGAMFEVSLPCGAGRPLTRES